MVDQKLTELTEDTSPSVSDLAYSVKDPGGSPLSRKVIWDNILDLYDSKTSTLTNKTFALGSNTFSGTTAQFNTALTDGSFATLAGTETLTNKTIDGDDNTIVDINETQMNVSVGASGTVLTSNGVGLAPTYQAAAGGSQTPWTSDIDADGFDLTDLSNIQFRTTTGAPAGTIQAMYADAGGININVPTGDILDVQVNAVSQMTVSATTVDFQANTLTDIVDITSITNLNGVAIANYALATGDTYTGTHDFGGADDLEIPNGAAPTVDTTGQIAFDTTITSHLGMIKIHDGTQVLLVPTIREADLTTTDNDVIAYSSANGRLQMEPQSGAGGGGDNLGNHTAEQDLAMATFDIDNAGVIFLNEQADANADVAGQGQIWVNTATPNELYFTDDAGNDHALASDQENLSFFAATTSAQLAGVISDETGTGVLVFGTNPTLTAATMAGDLDMDGNDIDDGGVIFLREQADANADVAGQGQIWVDTQTPNVLFFTDDAGTDFRLSFSTSAQLAAMVSDETGSGSLVFATSPTLVTPALGTPASGVLTNCTGLPTAGLVDEAVTFAKMQHIATDRLLGRDTAATGDVEEISLGASLEFGGSGTIQRAALTGDVTAAANSNTTAIAAGVIVNADVNASAAIAISKLDTAVANATGDTFTGVHDFGGATSLEIPNSATPTVDAAGEIAIDTTITDFTGLIKYHDGTEELAVVAMPVAELTSPTDTHVVTYNATNNEFELAAGGGGGGATDTEFGIPLTQEVPEGTVAFPAMHDLATASAHVSGLVLPDVTASTINLKTAHPIPDDLASTPAARIEFVIMTKGAVAGPADVRLTVSSLAVADTENFDQAFTAETETTVTMPTATETCDVYSQDMTTDPSAGDTVLVKLARDPTDAADDFTDDIQIISATLWIHRST